MSLPENLVLGGAFPTGTALASITMNKAQFGRYVASNINLDNPIEQMFKFQSQNNGLTRWDTVLSEHRSVSATLGSGQIDYSKKDSLLKVGLFAIAPIGVSTQGYFTQAEVALRIRQVCIEMLTGDTIDRMVRGEL